MKRILRYIALFLALSLLLCGCADKPAADDTGGAGALGYPKAASVMDPDTVMLTVAAGEVTWSELYYWTVSSLELTRAETGGLPGWDEIVQDMTFEAFTKADAAKAALLYRVVEQKAAEMGVALSDEDRAALDSQRAAAVEYNGGEEGFQRYLEENYLTDGLYRYLQEVSSLYYGLFVGYFGENGEKCTDVDAVGVVENEGYLRVKHILVETQAEAEEILAQLDAAGAEYMNVFQTLMENRSADTSQANFPEGYLFAGGEMDEAFENAARALDYNQYSGVVETGSGYHIILRLPIDPDVLLTEGYTIRYYAASVLFENIVSEWAETAEAEAVFSTAYENLSLRTVFKDLKE